ncbi:MAG: M16 family metallopeptidase, partial [Desulfomonilaceae bacterium]
LPDQLEVTWPQATSTRLSNGIQVIVIPDDANQLVSFKILHLGGKRFETEKTQGIMNFVASMLTKGAGDLQEFEISKRIEEKGGRVSCFSGWDSFGVSLTILSHYIEFGVNLLSTIFKNPTFPKREMERERQFILNKIKNETDDPVQFIVNRLCKILYGSHPYGFNTLGTLATVSKFSEQDLMDCYRQFSNPSNTVISVVGAIDPGNALKIIDKFFGDVPPSSFEPPIVPFETRIDQQREEILRINKAKAHIVIGFKTISLADQDRYPLDVLNNLLSGQGGRLFLELRDKKSLAYSVTSFLRYKLGPGFMGFYIACATPKVDRAVSGLLAEIEKIKSINISDQEIRNSKANLIGNHETSLQTTWSRADNYGHNTLFGLGWNYDFEYTNKILEVKAEDVSRVARRYLDTEKRITVKIIPESYVE